MNFKKSRVIGMSLLCLMPLTSALAQPIRFVISGELSGVSEPAIFLNQIKITNAMFKVVIDADTRDIQSSYSFDQILATSATFSIDGVGVATASAPALAVDYGAGSPVSGLWLNWDDVRSPLLWFSGSVLGNGAQVLTENSAASPLNLQTPLTNSRALGAFPYTAVLQFPGVGALGISGMANVTFSASMVPEPSALSTFTLAFVALTWHARRRRAT